VLRDVFVISPDNIHVGDEFVGLEAGCENDHVCGDEALVCLDSVCGDALGFGVCEEDLFAV
jgi:hypothetical protein